MAKRTKAEEAASYLGKLRWKNVPDEERTAFMKQVRAKRSNAPGGRGGGRPRSTDRCYCGELTWTRAVARAFGCCKKKGMYPTGKKDSKFELVYGPGGVAVRPKEPKA